MLEEQIEEILNRKITNRPETNKQLAQEIGKIIPNNEWVEYDRTDFSKQPGHWDNKFYDVTFKNGSVGQLQYYPQNYRWWEVIAFKPTPVEPYKKEWSEVEIVDTIINRYPDSVEFHLQKSFLKKLKEKFLNGEIAKWK